MNLFVCEFWIPITFLVLLVNQCLGDVYDDVAYNGTSYNFTSILTGIGGAKYDAVTWLYQKSSESPSISVGFYYEDKVKLKSPYIDRVQVFNSGQNNMFLHFNSLSKEDTGLYEHSIVLANGTDMKMKIKLAVPYKVWIVCIKKSTQLRSIPHLTNQTEIEDHLKADRYKNEFKYESKACDIVAESLDKNRVWLLAEYYNGNVSCITARLANQCTHNNVGAVTGDNSSSSVKFSVWTLLVSMCLIELHNFLFSKYQSLSLWT